MKTEIVLIVDKSGSMATLANDTIGGFNKFIGDQIENEIDANVSVLFFDTDKKWFQSDIPLKEVKKLDRDSYSPSGGTALNDAIASAYHVLEFKNPAKAVVVIITDGEENSSKETAVGAVKTMIGALQRKDYRIVYLAANVDAFSTGAQLGISAYHTANIRNDSKGIQAAYAAASNSSVNYASNGMRGLNVSTQSMVDLEQAK